MLSPDCVAFPPGLVDLLPALQRLQWQHQWLIRNLHLRHHNLYSVQHPFLYQRRWVLRKRMKKGWYRFFTSSKMTSPLIGAALSQPVTTGLSRVCRLYDHRR
uniref:(northern house mosquito) hypothetical protein n=1 Tax=Culex pipiens TaxID=7175 RepID=A0A8D8HFN3_CULPI